MQKKVGNALYVFDTTPFTITKDTDAEVIYVQQEYLKGYLELNTELESKIKTFNQWLLCVNAPWADGGSPEPEPTYHLLTVSSTENLWVQNYDAALPPGNTNESWFDSFVNWQVEAGMIESDERNKIYCNAGAIIYIDIDASEFETISGLEQITIPGRGEKYGFVMGDSDMTVNYSYTLKPTYNVDFSEDSNASNDVNIVPSPQMRPGAQVNLQFNNGQSSSTIAVTSEDVELQYVESDDQYYFIMPAHDVTIKAVYTQPIEISIDLGDTDLTTSFDPSATYYPHAFFAAQVPEGKTTDDYTFVKSDDEGIAVVPVGDHFDMEFKVSGSVTFANA